MYACMGEVFSWFGGLGWLEAGTAIQRPKVGTGSR